MIIIKKLILLTAILLTANSFSSYQGPDLNEFLKEFHANPIKVYNQRHYRDGMSSNIKFNLTNKLIWRKNYFSGDKTNKSRIEYNDYVHALFENPDELLLNAYEIDKKKLRSGKVKYTPWTGYYWSTDNGLIANRYNDRRFRNKWTFKGKYKYYQKRSPDYYIQKGKIDQLSPAEKYELLIGDREQNFSKYIWQKGLDEVEKYGNVRDWAGLCHGLALAPAALPWPKYAVKIKSFDGKHIIKFYPEDIKALGIHLWGGDQIQSRRVGGRCESYNPSTDEMGRVTDPDCQDTNPGTFHLAVINRVGVQKDILIMDNAYDKSVWNFPITKYKFTYFNLNTNKKMNKITDAMIPIEKYGDDKFKKYRTPGVKYIVGVEARIKYLNFRQPIAKDKDPTTNPPEMSDYYRYDLELDIEGNIVGGEWYFRSHPDFLWVPFENTDPQATFDYKISGKWDPKTTLLPENWVQSARLSTKSGEVSSKIVKALFKLSHEGIKGVLPN
jgi:hypothetical protein